MTDDSILSNQTTIGQFDGRIYSNIDGGKRFKYEQITPQDFETFASKYEDDLGDFEDWDKEAFAYVLDYEAEC